MTTSIIKFNKTNLTITDSKVLSINASIGLSILQYADNTISTSHDIPFQISVADRHAPYVSEEMVTVIRGKVDLTATGTKDVLIKNIGKDRGEYGIDNKPYIPKDLPPGFQEVLRL